MGKKKENLNLKDKFKKLLKTKDTDKLIIPIIVAFLIIITIIIVICVIANKEKPEDQYEKIVKQTTSYIQYSFDFSGVNDYKKEYSLMNARIAFEITNEGISSFSYNGNNKIQTVSKKFDVYYLKKEKAAIIIVHNDLTTDMYFAKDKDMTNISEIVKGAFSFNNISIDGKNLSFDVQKWTRTEYSDYTDYLVLTDVTMFSAYSDDYTQYVQDDYAVEATYKYNLGNKDFKLENFDISTIKTMKQLAEEISNLGE